MLEGVMIPLLVMMRLLFAVDVGVFVFLLDPTRRVFQPASALTAIKPSRLFNTTDDNHFPENYYRQTINKIKTRAGS